VKVLVLHGPNLNLLGRRDPGVYGTKSLDQINEEIEALASQLGLEVEFFQSNQEGVLIERIQKAAESYEWIVFNPGAFTHYSYALRDAVAAAGVPTIEVHLSNIQAREEFRSRSVIAPVCAGQISGFGAASYFLALYAIFERAAGQTGGI